MGTDFEYLKINVIVIETLQTRRNGTDPIEFLKKKGYTCDKLRQNHFCVLSGFVPSRMPRDVFLAVRHHFHPTLPPDFHGDCKKIANMGLVAIQDCEVNF